MALDSCEPTEDEKLNQNEDQKLIGDLNNAIKCCDCHATSNDKDLFWCLNCNRKRIFCDECGKSMHLTTKHQHQHQVQAVKKINLVDIENLTKDGHDILKNYRNLSWYMRKSLAISIAENIVRKCPIGVMMARLVSKQLITSASRVASNITLNALCAGIGTGVVIAVEMGYHFYMWHKGNIDKQELKRRLVKTVATGIPTGAACFGGAVLGAAIGSLAGPVGSIIGAIVGGLIAATIAGVGADKVFERYFPSNEKKSKGNDDKGSICTILIKHRGSKRSKQIQQEKNQRNI